MLLGKPNIALGHGPQSSLWVWPRVLGRLVAIWLPRPSHCLGPLVASMDVHLLLGKPNIALGHGPQSSGQSREKPISPSPWNSFVLNGYGEKMSHMMSHSNKNEDLQELQKEWERLAVLPKPVGPTVEPIGYQYHKK